MAGINSITGSGMNVTFTASAQNNVTGQAFSPNTGGVQVRKNQVYGTGVGNSSLGGADEVYAAITTITTSGSVTINVASITNIMQQTAQTVARIKGWAMQLLSLTDDTVNGTACSSVVVGASPGNPFTFNWGGTTPTHTIYNGGIEAYFDQQNGGFTVSGSNQNVKILNNDSINTGAFQFEFFGGST